MCPSNKNLESRLLELKNWALQYDPDPQHSSHVCFLCNRLFDEMYFFHRLEKDDLFLLQASALLHDIGWSAGSKGHHKSSMKMILCDDTIPLDKENCLLVANIARYHRKSLPKDSHKNFMSCSTAQQKKIRILSSFLRLADGLDASHQSIVRDLSILEKEDELVLTIDIGDNDILYEEESLKKKKTLFEQTFEKKLMIQCKKKI